MRTAALIFTSSRCDVPENRKIVMEFLEKRKILAKIIPGKKLVYGVIPGIVIKFATMEDKMTYIMTGFDTDHDMLFVYRI